MKEKAGQKNDTRTRRYITAGARLVLVAFSLFWSTAVSFAAPFNRDLKFIQPDGTAITVQGRGDEIYAELTYNGYDVMAVRRNGRLAYVYAKCNAARTALEATDALAGVDEIPAGIEPAERKKVSSESRKASIKKAIDKHERRTGRRKAWEKMKSERIQRVIREKRGGIKPMTIKPIVGDKRGLTILVDFSDDPQPEIFPVAEADALLNGENYTNFENYSSVRSYYKDVSNGKVDYQNTVVGYVRMPKPKAYYMDLDQSQAIYEFFTDLFDVLNSMPEDSEIRTKLASCYADLTITPGDGENPDKVSAFNVFYAGSDGGVWAHGLWPCSGPIMAPPEEGSEDTDWTYVYLDLPGGGPAVNSFQITNIGDSPDISTFCHENGHMLFNFNDFYDYDYDSKGVGKFCLMSENFSKCPQQVSAYLKYITGWAEPVYFIRDEDFTAKLHDASTETGYEAQNKIFVYENPDTQVDGVAGTATEYYLFENRQQSLRDNELPAAGIAIWHADEKGNRDEQSTKYNTKHQNYELTLVQADGLNHLQKNVNAGDENDLWYEGNSSAYYQSQSGVFSDRTFPSARWWNGSNSYLNVQSFSVTGATMTLNFKPSMVLYSFDKMPKGRVGTYYDWRVPVLNVSTNHYFEIEGGEIPAGLEFVVAGENEVYLRGYPMVATNVTTTLKVVSKITLGSVSSEINFEILPPFTLPYQTAFGSDTAMDSVFGWTQEPYAVYSEVAVTNSVAWDFRDGNGTTGRKGAPAHAYSAPSNLAFVPETGVLNGKDSDKANDIHAIGFLTSPMFDCSGMRQVKLSFMMCKSAYNSSVGYLDELRVYCRNTPHGEWKLLKEYTENIPSWREQEIVLPVSDEDRSQLYFGFEALSNDGNGVHIDNVQVFDPVLEFKFAQTALPDVVVNSEYNQTIEIEGGIEPFVWSVNGQLPPGITLENGVLSGTCATEGVYTFDVTVKDFGGGENSAQITGTFTLVVDKPRVVLFSETFESPTGNIPSYWRQESESDDGTNVWWILSCGGSAGHGQYPALAQEGAYNALLFWSDIFSYNRPNHVTRLITPEIYFGENSAGTTLTFWLCMRELLRGDGLYDQDVLKIYFKEKENDSWGEPLLTIDTSVDKWSYQRVALPEVKSGYICFEGNALYGNGVMLDDIRVGVASEAPVVMTRDLAHGFASVPYSAMLSAVGGTGSQTWSVASGSALPDGMTLSANGEFAGTPRKSGVYSFKVQVSDENGNTYSATLKWNVRAGIRYSELSGSFDADMDWQSWTFTTNRVKGWEFTNGSFKSPELDNAPVPVSAYSGNTNACLFHDGVSSIAKATMSTPMVDLSWTEDAKLRFAICKKNKSSTYKDTLQVAYRLSYADAPVVLTNITASIEDWTEIELPLPEVSETMFFDFIGTARCGYGIAIDDIVFTATDVKVDTPYEIWKQKWYGDKNYDDDADTDGDGLSTMDEFVFGADPTAGDSDASRLYPVMLGGGEFGVTFREGKEAREFGVEWRLLWSTNLKENVWFDEGIEFVSEAESNSWWQVIYKHEKSNIGDEPRRFFKLSAEMP